MFDYLEDLHIFGKLEFSDHFLDLSLFYPFLTIDLLNLLFTKFSLYIFLVIIVFL